MTTIALNKGHEALITEARNLPDGWRGEILFKCPIYGQEVSMKQIKHELRLRLDEILYHGRLMITNPGFYPGLNEAEYHADPVPW